jgi:hypothetical protein
MYILFIYILCILYTYHIRFYYNIIIIVFDMQANSKQKPNVAPLQSAHVGSRSSGVQPGSRSSGVFVLYTSGHNFSPSQLL